jgi:replicative DNA helicase
LSYSQVIQKLTFIDTGIQINELRKGKLSAKEIDQMNIDDCGFMFISELENKIKRYVSEKKVELIIIDYLQLITVEDGKTKRNNYQKKSYIIKQLKKVSIELGISIIVLSQLSRNCELRFNWERRPCLTDLTMSKKYIDKTLLLFRPEYYKMTKWDDEKAALTFEQAEIIVAKKNNGNLGSARLHFTSCLGKFENLIQN